MPWIQVKLDTTRDQSEALEDLLLAIGAKAVTLQDGQDQPVFEPALGTTPLWDSTQVIGLFEANTEVDLVLAFLANELSPLPLPNCKVEIVEDKDWEREWMDNYHPIQFGKRLWVCPSWRETPDPSAANLILDPGLAFGTGTHPTTALCLEWLGNNEIANQQVIDYGCGSGILGIAALILGATNVAAIDNDPQALEATIANGQRNNIAANRLHTFLPEQAPDQPIDIMLANILAGPLINLAERLASLTKTGGKILLSGILKEQAETVIACYSQWFTMEPPTIREDWVSICGVKN
ncbi:50S ribosomal protein L11 methyltransferase [Endozoicomonas sp. SM1973]|uniref:Ribosomal protein L11 methyltransferase n=2 Tax=Spartinivicinus marinus TaxID=2994442 RepID=A0A853I7P8_9GAMM|nr:50S ribosomal protein L11 methyltransferase [Spartinivicinus marinus]MCX4027624.1 50S ribosomal protein L11 methyltransferase [Spartinivicinus marinus]NYZ66678.1 50S ribosomal protein L11 methyltransferase [Spartinivicinus marinus]